MKNNIVRINIRDKEYLKDIDFSRIEEGIIGLSIHASGRFRKRNRKYNAISYRGIGIETYLDGVESVGIVSVQRDFLKANNIKEKTNIDPIIGTYDKLLFPVEIELIDDTPMFVSIQFITGRWFHMLENNENIEGLQSGKVDIEVYVDGILKPHSQDQCYKKGLIVIKDENSDNRSSKFYELNFIRQEENYPGFEENSGPVVEDCGFFFNRYNL